MKIRRFLSVFLLSVLLTALFLVPQAAAVDSPVLDAKCALLMDETAGRMLYGHNEKEKAYPASITKVMTALLTLEAVDRGDLSLSQPITASHLAVTSIDEDSSTAGIEAGDDFVTLAKEHSGHLRFFSSVAGGDGGVNCANQRSRPRSFCFTSSTDPQALSYSMSVMSPAL